MFRLLSTLLSVLKVFWIFTFFYVILAWYIKGHFGKYAIFFWLYTILVIVMYLKNPGYNPNWPQHDTTPGYVLWERNMKNY